MSRCTGHCCELFYLPFTPKQIKQVRKLKEKKERGHITFKKGKAVNANDGGLYEIKEIAEMVIPISPSKEKVTATILNQGGYHKDHYYTCKNFDKETRNCKIYSSRPHMCRNHPVQIYCKEEYIAIGTLKERAENGRCEYRNCTGCQNVELK